MFVWGKYNGWYRVETPDHIFGWVYYDYISAPGAEKITELSQQKARQASDRTAHQTMYGSKELLAKHYARYKAPGAAEGLKAHGVMVAALKPKTRVAKSSQRTKATRQATSRIAKATSIKAASARTSQTSIKRIPGSDRLSTQPNESLVNAPDMSFNDVGNVRLAPARPSITSEVANTYDTEARTAEPNVTTPRQVQAKVAPAARVAPVPAVVAAKPTPQVIKVATKVAPKSTPKVAAKPIRKPVARVVAKSIAKPAPQLAAQPQVQSAPKPAPKVVAKPKTAPRPNWRQVRAAARAKKLAARREALRRRMGTPRMAEPPTSVPGMRPISPEELMQAREAFLASRRKTAPSPDSNVASAPQASTGTDFLLTPSAWQGSAFQAGPAQGLTARGTTLPQFPALSQVVVTSHAQYSPKVGPTKANAVKEVTVLALKARATSSKATVVKLPGAKVTAVTSSQTKAAAKTGARPARLAPSRGGSPRDMAAYAQKNNAFGDGVAKQALSYRGMPYIRGASSPARGFDCSGLIYFLLRQRGYNPPRTAAGMAKIGQKVERGNLKPGDLVLFSNTYRRGISHIGVYIGENKFVHAATSRSGVRVDSLSAAYYSRKYYGARRVQ
jgi:cell wall-associated NlpC family hydrolase